MDKKKCSSCGGTPHKCSCKNKEFTKAVVEINNPEQITLMRKVVIPVSMGDDTTVPPTIGKYHNVLLYYEANSKSYLYSSDGIPTQLVNGFTNYEEAINLPQINGVTLLGDKSSADLKLADAPMVITVASGNTSWSGADTAEDVYDFFLNKGKVNIVFSGGENYVYEIASAGYIENESKLLCVVVAASTQATGGVTDFDGNALFGTMTLYTAGKAVDVSQIELQPKLFVTDFTGLDLYYNELSGVPATNASIGMVKPGDGLEVASDGTLSISDIEQYAHFFDTVDDMKAATNLVAGDYAKTLGYYTLNDVGGAYYKISSTTPSGYYETLTSGLYAELVIEDTMNVKQFGAKGDGIVDDTAKIQNAFDACNNIVIPSGTYMIDASTTLVPNDNNKIVLDNDATLKAITNDLETYRIIHIINKSNVEISGGIIEGDRATHTGATGEWGAGIRVYGNSTNVYIHDILIKDTWGDGITVATTGNVKTEHVHVVSARRNGYSIIRANEFISNDDIIENTGGTNPQAGVDIEPDNASHALINVAFNNLITKNNVGNGVTVHLLPYDNTSKPVNIAINNHYDYGSKSGFAVSKSIYTKGLITYSNAYLESSVDTAIRLWRCYDSDLAVKIIRPYIVNCDTSEQGALYGPGIAGYLIETDTLDAPLGNIEIIEPYITTAYADQTTAITIRNNIAGAQLQANNVKIIDPIYLQNKMVYIGANNTNIYFRDNYGATKFTSNSDYTVPHSQYFSVYSNTENTTGNKTLTIPDTMTPGRKMKFMNMNSSYSLSVKLPTTDYCYQLSNTVSPTVTLAKLGDTIELEKVTTTEWIISSINCTPTVS